MPTDEEVSAIKRRAAARLLQIPGVTAVGIGSKEIGGAPTGELAIKVYVRKKKSVSDVPPDEMIPAEVEGIPTDVVLGGDIVPTVGPPPGAVITSEDTDGDRQRPLVGGCRLARADSDYRGTFGCLLRHATDAAKFYAITNFHVLNPVDVDAAKAGDKVGQPSGIDSFTKCCSDTFGGFAGGGRSGERDEALIQLDPGTQWKAEILDIGVVHGTHSVTQTEATTGTYAVRKRGVRTLVTGGTISSLQATGTETDNLVVIKANPNPAAGGRTVFFQYEGDSGAVLVNDANEVVGLMWGRDNAGNGYAYAVDHVLNRLNSVEHLNVQVATAAAAGTVNTVPGAAMVAVPPELVPTFSPSGSPPALEPYMLPTGRLWPGGMHSPPLVVASQLQADLDRSEAGRLFLTLWLDHQDELTRLVSSNRRVAAAWHRSGGSALFQLLVRMLSQPELALPRTVNGQSLAVCIDRVQQMLSRFASPRLARALVRARSVLPDLGGRTYPQIIEALGAG